MLNKSNLPQKYMSLYFDGRDGFIAGLKKKMYYKSSDKLSSLHLYSILTKDSNSNFTMSSNVIGASLLPKEEYMEKWLNEANIVRNSAKKCDFIDSMKMRYDFLEKYYSEKDQFDDSCIVSMEVIGKDSTIYNNLKANPICILSTTAHFNYYKQTIFQFNCVVDIFDKDSDLYRFLDAMQFIYHIENPLNKPVCAYKFSTIETWQHEAPWNKDISKVA